MVGARPHLAFVFPFIQLVLPASKPCVDTARITAVATTIASRCAAAAIGSSGRRSARTTRLRPRNTRSTARTITRNTARSVA